MTKRVKAQLRAKGMTGRRRLSPVAARRLVHIAIAKTGRKQMIRQSGRRRGGR